MNDEYIKNEITKLLENTSAEEVLDLNLNLDDIINSAPSQDNKNDNHEQGTAQNTSTNVADNLNVNNENSTPGTDFSLTSTTDHPTKLHTSKGPTANNSTTDKERISFTNQNLISQEELDKIIKDAESIPSQRNSLKKASSSKINIHDLCPFLKDYKDSLPKKPKIVLPLEFITNYEFDNYKNNNLLRTKENKRMIADLDEFSDISDEIIKVYKKKGLMNHFSRTENGRVTCLLCAYDCVYAGNSRGQVITYSPSKEKEYKTFFSEQIFLEQTVPSGARDVTCLARTEDSKFFVAGYENGVVALWDIKESAKPYQTISGVHLSKILNVKFLSVSGKTFRIISSDIKGIIKLITVTTNFFGLTRIKEVSVAETDCPCFLLSTFYFTEEEKKNFSFDKKEIKNNMAVIGNMESTEIFLFNDDSLESVLVISNPRFDIPYCPDACFGCGYSSFYNELSGKEVAKTDTVDLSQSQVLLTVSWGETITLYSIPIINKMLGKPLEIGYFLHQNLIIRIGFYAESLLFFLDSEKKLHLINTFLMKDRKSVIENSKKERSPQKRHSLKSSSSSSLINVDSAPMKKGFSIDPAVEASLVEGSPNIPNSTLSFFYNFIVFYPKNIFILSRTEFNQLELLGWERCLENLQQKNINLLFSIGRCIYKGIPTGLADIPINAKIRKEKAKFVLTNYVNEYIRNYFQDYFTDYESSNIKITQKDFDSVSLAIEFSIEIEELQNLFTKIYSIFQEKGYANIFIEKINPFILKDKIKDYVFDTSMLTSLCRVYTENNGEYILGQVLPHLTINPKALEYIERISKTYSLFTPIISIAMNYTKKLFDPAKEIFSAVLEAKPTAEVDPSKEEEIKENLSSSVNFFNKDLVKCLGNQKFEETKEYLCEKLLWYIHQIVIGKNYPDSSVIPDQLLREFLPIIFLWLVSHDTFIPLLNIDSYTYFKVLSEFFTENKPLLIIKTISNDLFNQIKNEYNIKYTSLNQDIEIIKDAKLGKIIEMLESIILDECSDKNVKFDFYNFIVKISQSYDLNVEMLSKAGNFIISSSSMMSLEIDKMKCHVQLEDTQYITELSDDIIEMIDKIKDICDREKKNFQDLYLSNLLLNSEYSIFFPVKIHLLTLSRNYTRCIDILLAEKSQEIFDFIENNLTRLKEEVDDTDFDYFTQLKDYILEKLPMLADISIEKMASIVNNFFNDCKEKVIHKLDNVPEMQYKYIDKIIESYIEEEKNINENEINAEISSLLFMQLRLLIQLNRSNQIILKLKEKGKKHLYPLKECLDLCLENKVIDACIYLYQQLGENKKALDLEVSEVRRIFDEMLKTIFSGIFGTAEQERFFEDLNKNIETATDICEEDADKIDSYDNIDLWLDLLGLVYEIIKKVKTMPLSAKDQKIKTSTEGFIDYQLEKLLKKMCCYVSIPLIISNIPKDETPASKEFIQLIRKMLSSFLHLVNVFKSGKMLLGKSVLYTLKELKEMSERGINMRIDKCDICKKTFGKSPTEMICIFNCGHKMHQRCSIIEDGEVVCVVCRKNDIEAREEDPIEDILGRNRSRKESRRTNRGDSQMSGRPVEEKINQMKQMKRAHLLSRLKTYDKSYFSKINLIDG